MIDDIYATNGTIQTSDPMSGNPSSIQATIDGQLMSVPLDLANRHYVAILKQVAAGTLTITPANGV